MTVAVHGALHPAARHPAGKTAVTVVTLRDSGREFDLQGGLW